MRLLWRRLFPKRESFGAYLVVLTACLCGLLGVPWWAGIFLPGTLLTLLTLLSWHRWHELAAKAAKVDADYRELGMLELRHGVGWGVANFGRAHQLLLLLTLKFSQDWFFAGMAYGLGVGAGWFWGVGSWGM